MNESKRCQSCGMPIDDGTYCRYCTDENGNLMVFEERLERMTQWMMSQQHAASPAEATAKALAHMATMPAWRDHPTVRRAAEGR